MKSKQRLLKKRRIQQANAMAEKLPPSRWHSRKGAEFYMKIVSLESSLAGLLSSGLNQNGWEYIYNRNDDWFKGLNSPIMVKFAIDNLIGQIEETISQFIPKTPFQRMDYEILSSEIEHSKKVSNDSFLIQKACFEKRNWISKSYQEKINLEFPNCLRIEDNVAFLENEIEPFSGFHFCMGLNNLKGASFFRGVLHGEIVEVGYQNDILRRKTFQFGYESFENGFPDYYPRILTPGETIVKYYFEGTILNETERKSI